MSSGTSLHLSEDESTPGRPEEEVAGPEDGGSPTAVELSRQGGGVSPLLDALEEIRAFTDTDLIIRRGIEIARDRIGIRRARIFLLDRSRKVLLGTWGMDPTSAVVEEHHIIEAVGASDSEAVRRSEDGRSHFTVFENCPTLERAGGASWSGERGRVAKTPIRSSQATLGILFNDAGPAGGPVDEPKQAQVAVLCSVLGTMLDPLRGWRARWGIPPGCSPGQRLVAATLEKLDKDPGLGTKSMAADLNISASRLSAVFKSLMGISLVDYRNLLRLERFETLVERGPATLMEAALAAGFGSYAQFHRVLRARLQTTPRKYVRAHVDYGTTPEKSSRVVDRA